MTTRPPIAPLDEMQGFLEMLEHARLELVEAIIAQSDKGYDDRDLEKLALQGNAVRSVKEAIEFRRLFDAK